MLVSDLMTRHVESARPDDTLFEVASRMRTRDVGIIPVVENDEPVGTITDRDITVRGVAEGFNPLTTPVRDVMTRDVVTCSPDTSVDEAADLMRSKRVRRLLVMDDDSIAGMVSLGDLALQSADREGIARTVRSVSEPTG